MTMKDDLGVFAVRQFKYRVYLSLIFGLANPRQCTDLGLTLHIADRELRQRR